METLRLLYLFSGILLAVLSIPLILRKVKPNPFYGFRIEKTLDNEEIWYKVNRYTGWRLLVTAIAILVSALALPLIPGISVDAYALACLFVFCVFFFIGLVQAVRYMKTLGG